MGCVIRSRIQCDCTDWLYSDLVSEKRLEAGECHRMRGGTVARVWIGHVRDVVRTVEIYSSPTVGEGERDDHDARVALCWWKRKGVTRSGCASKVNLCTEP